MSTENNSSPFDFPIDILRCIVEFAVWNDTETAQILELVNRAFRLWAGPAAYRTVILRSPSTLIGFSELLRAAPVPSSVHATAITRDTEFYAKNVKYLGIFKPKVPESVLDPIFSICTGVVTLELENVTFKRLEACAMRPQEIIIPTNITNSLETSLFENLTHVWTSIITPTLKSFLPRLKCLAILFPIDLDLNQMEKIFTVRELPELEMLVLNLHALRRPRYKHPPPQLPQQIWNDVLLGVKDGRIVIRNSFMYNSEPESTVALRMGISIWELALLDGHRHPAFAGSTLTPPKYL
jgi:hypothetical protein